VVINDLDVRWTRRGPPKTDPELIVHSDRVLTGTVPYQFLQAVSWRNAQVAETFRSIQLS
jgi:hypothetical protein